jgi:hypothetical protein
MAVSIAPTVKGPNSEFINNEIVTKPNKTAKIPKINAGIENATVNHAANALSITLMLDV